MDISRNDEGIELLLDGCDATIPEAHLEQLRATAETGHKNFLRNRHDDTVHTVRTARKGRVLLALLNGGADTRLALIPYKSRKAIASCVVPTHEATELLKL